MGFNLREYDHVEKFTLYQCIERLKQEGLSTDIVMLLIFESVLDFPQEVSHIPIYGQHEKSYRFDARKYPGEMSEICNVYRWYQNIAVNPKALSEDFCDEDLSVLNTFFFDKKEFLDFFNLPYDQAIELENLSKPVIDSTELQEEKAKNAQLQAEIERLKAENAELRSQLQDNAQRKSAVDSDDFSIYGHKSELLDILFKVIAEFWADSETPPKNSVIEQWIETNYPVKDYPYVSKAVRQYIATILRPQPKLK